MDCMQFSTQITESKTWRKRILCAVTEKGDMLFLEPRKRNQIYEFNPKTVI